MERRYSEVLLRIVLQLLVRIFLFFFKSLQVFPPSYKPLLLRVRCFNACQMYRSAKLNQTKDFKNRLMGFFRIYLNGRIL